MTTYPVADIQRFCVHDGPGIRTVVFLKGCPMRCPWCANPESQSRKRVLLYDRKKCVGCGSCQVSCPDGAIQILSQPNNKGGRRVVIQREKCKVCGICGRSCPANAITYSGTDMTTEEIMDEIMKDADYYNASGGGVTLSGGEALTIGDRLSKLLKQFRVAGVHTAVETCGMFSYHTVQCSLNNVDLFLYDVKHVDGNWLKNVTGGDVRIIMENLKSLIRDGRNVTVRVPVIPGFNHTREDMEEIVKTIKSCGGKRIELLPYHTLGRGKYDRLGRKYGWGDIPMLSKSDLEVYRDLLEP